jgi:hypothetical protein
MLWKKKKKIIRFLHESEIGCQSIARTAFKATDLIEKLVESKEPKKELDKWLVEQNSL